MTAIRVESLSKEYAIGGGKYGGGTFREKVAGIVAAPFRRRRGIEGYTPRNERFWALKDVSFEVRPGEVLGIIGRNGAGKSTLLKILSRITEPTAGRVELTGRMSSLLEVGTGFHPELSGRENIFLNGSLLGMAKAEIRKKFDEIVAFSEVEKFIDTPVKHYSSGMYVRLAFAVAAHLEPEILIVDEVLSVGDVQFQRKCLGKMGEASEEGRTVLLVSHNLAAVRALCRRAILLRDGMLVADDTPSVAVKKYMGEIEEHVFAVKWRDEESAPRTDDWVLKGVAICDGGGKQVDAIDTDGSFNVEIDYKVKRDRAFVGINMIIYDNDNNCILASINNHEPNWYGKAMQAGHYKSICKVPNHLLNNGYYRLGIVIFGKNFTESVTTNDILNFEIQDGSKLRSDYLGEYACHIRPSFEWITVRGEKATG